MAWLVDTDVLSERARKTPNQRVLSWLEQNAADVYTSTQVVGELQAGVSALPDGAKRRSLQHGSIVSLRRWKAASLSFNTNVATLWGHQESDFAAKGCPMPMPDSFIAATARRHNLTIVTRNTADYKRPGIKSFNPY
jgi:toxin FitB